MLPQAIIGILAYCCDFACKAEAIITFGKQGSLGGVSLRTVFTGEVNHPVSDFASSYTFTSGEDDPFGCKAYGGKVAWSEGEGESITTYLIQYSTDELIVRDDVMYKILCRISELGERLFYFYLFGHVDVSTGSLQAGIPQSIELVPFCAGGFNAFVGNLEALIAFLQHL